MGESERFAHMFDKSIGLVRKWSEIRVGLMAVQNFSIMALLIF